MPMTVRHEGAGSVPECAPMQPCCTKDEGRSLGTAMQVEVSNYLKLPWSKARVVSVKEKAKEYFVR